MALLRARSAACCARLHTAGESAAQAHCADGAQAGALRGDVSAPVAADVKDGPLRRLGGRLRAALREWPAPVTVVTAATAEPYGLAGSSQDLGPSEEALRGMTCGSFTSVSLQPALVSFNVRTDSQMGAALHASPAFAVHLLGEANRDYADVFSTPGLSGVEQFRKLDPASWQVVSLAGNTPAVSDGGLVEDAEGGAAPVGDGEQRPVYHMPVLSKCKAVLLCRKVRWVELGDSHLVVGRVLDIVCHDDASGATPAVEGSDAFRPLLYIRQKYLAVE